MCRDEIDEVYKCLCFMIYTCMYSKTCLIQDARGEKFCVEIDKLSVYVVKTHVINTRNIKTMLDNTGKRNKQVSA